MIINTAGGGGAKKPLVYQNTGLTAISTIASQETFNLPIKDAVGNTLPATLTINSVPFDQLMISYKKIRIPEYFTSVSIPNSGFSAENVAARMYAVEEVEIESLTASWDSYSDPFASCVYLKRFSVPNRAGTFYGRFMNSGLSSQPTGRPVSTSLVINAPKCSVYGALVGRSGQVVDMTGSNIGCTGFLTNYGGSIAVSNLMKYWYGTLVLPYATAAGYINTPASSAYTTHLRMPRLTGFTQSSSFNNTSDTGILHVYIGPDLVTVTPATNMLAYQAQNRLYVHIPAGDSTTKTTLDNAGIAYTQDYNYTEDL